MKKIAVIVFLLSLFACETGIDLNLDIILKHTAEHVILETSSDTVSLAIVNLSWTWGIYGMPQGDGVIIERQINTSFDSVGYVTPIETLMTFFDTTDALTPGMNVVYKLSLLSGKAIDSMITSDFTIPAAQHFYEPAADTVTIDTLNPVLHVVFADLPMFEETDVELYKTTLTDLDSLLTQPVSDILTSLTDTIYATTTTDTVVDIDGSNIDSASIYIIKISASAMSGLDYITDTSIGLRPFIRLPW
ncbi:hypothetical protein JXB22_04735 [candidate division WOR-3 bacterium]|nr:hypothetical protein [candidate division WOR-3 bacterium]